MKSVLISIQPKWCELIASGDKIVEVRKTKPKIKTPFKCYIYETQSLYKGSGGCLFNGRGKVIGEFVCDSIANYEAELWDDETYERIQEFFEPDDFAEYGEYEYKTIADNGDDFWKENMLCQPSCLTIEELRKYVGCGIATFYGWHISDLVIYDKPKELSEFHKVGYTETKASVSWLTRDEENSWQIKRPPQSWCYVDHPTEKGGGE